MGSCWTDPMNDKQFMSRALELAKKGEGRVSPNPMVGCVIVRGGRIIAEGYHRKFGGPHAEINALRKIGFQAPGATMYVTLEPCHYHGKTPPCVEPVIASGVKRVVIAMKDPHPGTNGRSIRRLKAAGITVTTGVCRRAAQTLNKVFIKNVKKRLPYVIVKVAQSLDGKIATRAGKQTRITGPAAGKYVQDLRARVDGVLVGRGTVAMDDPRLNVRDRTKRQPRRVILDSRLSTSLKARIFLTHGGRILFVCRLPAGHRRVRAFEKRGAKVICLTGRSKKKGPLRPVLKRLFKEGLGVILVEGGREIFTSFLRENLVDEWIFLVAPKVIGRKGLPAFDTERPGRFEFLESRMLGTDVLIRMGKS